jgi:peroxiredoxin
MVSLQNYKGRRVLLFFSDPQCGPCDELAPHLARLSREHANDGPSIVMVGRGSAEENRLKAQQHGIEFPVLLQDRKWRVSKAYDILATPAAFLIGENGLIDRNPAVGKDAILALVQNGRA